MDAQIAQLATVRSHNFRDAHLEAFEMQTEHHRYIHRRPMRRRHITAFFDEAEYAADPGLFFLSTTVRLFP
jgi:hypothetical protein